jgi:flagellar basal body-associated protein FliL
MKIKIIIIAAVLLAAAGITYAFTAGSSDCEKSCPATKECPEGSSQCCKKK